MIPLNFNSSSKYAFIEGSLMFLSIRSATSGPAFCILAVIASAQAMYTHWAQPDWQQVVGGSSIQACGQKKILLSTIYIYSMVDWQSAGSTWQDNGWGASKKPPNNDKVWQRIASFSDVADVYEWRWPLPIKWLCVIFASY